MALLPNGREKLIHEGFVRAPEAKDGSTQSGIAGGCVVA